MGKAQTQETVEQAKCLICSNAASKRCSGCHEANYCSVEHQRQDWKSHKKVCSPYQVSVSEENGRHLVASRDLVENTVLVKEEPLAYAPADLDTTSGIVPLCLGCCVELERTTVVVVSGDEGQGRCSKCKWPLCSAGCEKLKCHREFECEILQRNGVSFPPKKPGAVYGSILLLRLLLEKERNPSSWKKLQELSCRNKLRESEFKVRREKEMILENLQEFYGKEEDLYGVISKEQLFDAIERVNLHSMSFTKEIAEERNKRKIVHFRGLYSKIGLLSLSCVPNTVTDLTLLPSFTMILSSGAPLKKGEVLQYAPEEESWIFQGTYHRVVSKLCGGDQQQQMSICHCARCSDPTELGNFTSALKCPVYVTSSDICSGYLVPENPLDLNAEALWKCTERDNSNNGGCMNFEEQEKVMSLLQHFELDMEKSVARILNDDCCPLAEKLGRMDELYGLYCKSRLHANHYIVRRIQEHYLQVSQAHLPELSFELLDRLIFHLEKLLEVTASLTTAWSYQSATLRLNLCRAMLRKKLKAAKEAKTSEVFGSKTQMLEYLKRLDRLQRESLEYSGKDPSVSNQVIIKQLKEENALVIRDTKLTISQLLK